MYDDENNNGGWYFEEIKSRQETDGERKGLYTFDGGNCDFGAIAVIAASPTAVRITETSINN